MMTNRLFMLATLSLLASGCQIWIGGGDDDCEYYPEPPYPGQEVRDPYTGQCSWTGGGSGGGGTWICDDDYGYGGVPATGAAEAEPGADRAPALDWGLCYSECSWLDETTCQATPGCRAAYVSNCPEGQMCPETSYQYVDCWDTAPSGGSFGACENLDAYECSRRDNCVAIHYSPNGNTPVPSPAPQPGPTPDGGGSSGSSGSGNDSDSDAPGAPAPLPPAVGNFFTCAAEGGTQPTGCYSDQECQPGLECNADEICLPPPGCDPMVGCPAVCYGYCVPPADRGDCYSEVLCESLPPACPPDSIPGRRNGCWTGECIPVNECEMNNPGTCYGDVFCDSLPPECPQNMVPGILNGCWSGACIPLGECEQPVSCAEASSESACIARAECTPVYEGLNCTCDASGNCTCSDWQYDYCSDECLMDDDSGFCVMGAQNGGPAPSQP